MDKIKFTEKRFLLTLCFVVSLFLIWGVALSMSDVLNKHFQNVLKLSKSQSGLIQMSVFGAYLIMSIPAGMFMKKFGYKKGIILGLFLFALGTLCFIPAANVESFNFFRFALFLLGCGMATLETVAHPFMAALGDQRSSDRRLNMAQSFNAVGTIIGPSLGAYFLLRSDKPGVITTNLDSVKELYFGIFIVIIIFLVLFFFIKVPELKDPHASNSDDPSENIDTLKNKPLFKHRHFSWAVFTQFFNIASQGGTWAFFINYGHEIMHYSDEKAATYMSLFMACMAIGRFAGTFLMKYIAPNKLLALFAVLNIIMCLIVAQGWGMVSYVCLFMINFFFSIMYPTIFSLGIKDMGEKTQQASSFISMGVAGGAFFPILMGLVANHNVAHAYYLPIICYFIVFLYGIKFYNPKR
ncbi:L-fucose:H+ symporter permease [Rhizosphaericola mali]|uniref:L-fucose:H+ symporter permease n=1 Tax=Rhizosphaericola mali TaxID=2545455 RepID=A0A5P2G644_9BACT|nr:L-fucose:H+ symporter permease [Rhizosphaericola mali]QES89362.1 L-fucose:H+ symporter permease [Rhizosphaericola mali]